MTTDSTSAVFNGHDQKLETSNTTACTSVETCADALTSLSIDMPACPINTSTTNVTDSVDITSIVATTTNSKRPRRSLQRTTCFHNAAEMQSQLEVILAELADDKNTDEAKVKSADDDEDEDLFFFSSNQNSLVLNNSAESETSVGDEDGFPVEFLASAF